MKHAHLVLPPLVPPDRPQQQVRRRTALVEREVSVRSRTPRADFLLDGNDERITLVARITLITTLDLPPGHDRQLI